MFEIEVPASQELNGPSWLYIATAGVYFGLTLLSIVLFLLLVAAISITRRGWLCKSSLGFCSL
jgi:hypothetical protein